MLCEEVTALLPALVDGEHDADPAAALHVETCLRCQAELARYRRLLRTLALLRTRYAEPTPGLLGETLAALTDAAEEGARRTLLSGRRLAYAGAIGGTAVAAGATAALLIARSRKRQVRLAGRRPHRRANLPLERAVPGPANLLRPEPRRRAVAQLAEHRSPKPAVGGSIPSCPAHHAPYKTIVKTHGTSYEPTGQTTDGQAGRRQTAHARTAPPVGQPPGGAHEPALVPAARSRASSRRWRGPRVPRSSTRPSS